ncbi:uncharacterized protein LOC121994900 [Zingiber officinale]|uniref:uncharacterized protein LOC121994900 n=1 Tax=Zingiber officinale TaxID=94328 RepID=UPI001C4B63C8|nr:uncharacterized protein LOC121994900 [Zingiber officinale]
MGHMEGSQALVLFILCALLYHSVAADHTARYLSEAEEKELQTQLKSLNKPYVKSFKDEYGITFDCVDIYKQPAFDHPLLKNHTLQTAGVSFSDLNESVKFYGISAILDVYQLSGVLDTQTSATQIVVNKGETGPLDYRNVVQAGFHVHHEAEGDNLTHLFTYWTTDGYQKTGCFNIHCAGFIQTSERVTPGLVYTLSNLALSIFKDPKTSNWMLVNDKEWIGYWPKEIFNNLADSSQIQLSATASSPTDQPSPPTGNGELGGASFKNITVLNGELNPYPPYVQHAETFLDIGKPFYEAVYNVDSGLFYGGPGGWKPAPQNPPSSISHR